MSTGILGWQITEEGRAGFHRRCGLVRRGGVPESKQPGPKRGPGCLFLDVSALYLRRRRMPRSMPRPPNRENAAAGSGTASSAISLPPSMVLPTLPSEM